MEHKSHEPEFMKLIKNSLIDDAKAEFNIGLVYKSRTYQSGNKDAQEIARELGKETHGQIYYYIQYLDSLLEKQIPSTSNYALKTIQALESFRYRHSVLDKNDEARTWLIDICDKCRLVARDIENQLKAQSQNEEYFDRYISVAGIYVYSYDHYLNYKYVKVSDGDDEDDEHDRTFMKVGMSGVDARERVKGQGRITGMPEHPKLLYVFQSDENDLVRIESEFHNHLHAIGHGKNKRLGGGTEWYLTNQRTLKSIAHLLKLGVHYDYEQPPHCDE